MLMVDTPDTVGVAVITALVPVKSTIVAAIPIKVPPEEIPIEPSGNPVRFEPSPK
jgi:hypothetical protein